VCARAAGEHHQDRDHKQDDADTGCTAATAAAVLIASILLFTGALILGSNVLVLAPIAFAGIAAAWIVIFRFIRLY
jgi:galactitol-specific phosphotransferase system IIC component